MLTPMTPLQSWTLLIMLFLAIALSVWALIDPTGTIDTDNTDIVEDEHTDTIDNRAEAHSYPGPTHDLGQLTGTPAIPYDYEIDGL